MTRKRVLDDDKIRQVKREHKHGVRGFGYKSLALKHNVGASTIRDAIKRPMVRT